tara:strand:+ start:809 stop:2272 length:1464 start_codon:yes stop_codon:yes gene_type:complete
MSRIRANTITNQNANGAPNFPDGITVSGVITATVSNSTLNTLAVTGVSTFSNTVDINSNLDVSGNATVGGTLGVGGVLTYEDVTNVDSIGIVTARAGVNLVGNDLNVGSNIKIGNTSGIVTAAAFVPTQQLAFSHRNVIHNGCMMVSQRGISQTGANSSGYKNAPDRWRLNANGANVGTYTVSRSTDNPGEFGFSYKFDCTSARTPTNNEMLEFEQRIEGRNLQRFAKGQSFARQFALSFSVKTNVTGTYVVLLLDSQNSRMCMKTYTVSDSNWNRYSLIFPADTTGAWDFSTSTRLSVKFVLMSGSDFTSGTAQTTWGSAVDANSRVGQTANVGSSTSNEWYITGVQLEAGPVVTPYEHKDYTDVLRECMRYLYTTGTLGTGVWNGANSFFCAVSTPVPMRDHPGITMYTGNFSSINIEKTDTYGITAITNPDGGHGYVQSDFAQQYSGYHHFVVVLNTSYSTTEGHGGLVMVDANNDMFILDAGL